MKQKTDAAAPKRKKQSSISRKLVLIILSGFIAGMAILGIFSYSLNRGDVIRLKGEKALSVANAVAAMIDADAYQAVMNAGAKNAYWYAAKEYLNEVLQENDLKFLYVVDRDYSGGVHYFAEGFDPASGETETEFDEIDNEFDNFADEMYKAIDTGKSIQTDIYDSGEYGYVISGFAPVLNGNGRVVAVVGVDIALNEVLDSSNRFAFMLIAIAAVLCVLLGGLFTWYIRRSIGRPVTALTAAAEKIAEGDTAVELTFRSNDELGRLVEAFGHMTESTREQSRMLERLADGDLTVNVAPRGSNDTMGFAIEKMVENLNNMFGEINNSTGQVSSGSRQISDVSQALAQGATEQAAAVDELSRSMAAVAEKTGLNAQLAERAAEMGGQIKQNAEKGSGQMEQMISAVRQINEASQSINKVIKVIDDIAFQTNILALNAAVEAARAGQYGKGFAVVAEEVRSLAKKSSDSARDTGALIADSMEKTALGVKIADATFASLSEIVSGINESSKLVSDIARSSEEQSESIREINTGIDRVAQVVSQNSATAEESAAASQQMSSQADLLEGLVSRFQLKEQPALRGKAGKGLPQHGRDSRFSDMFGKY